MPTVTNQTLIPDWLRPLFENQAGIGSGALGSLSGMLGGENFGGASAENLVAGFTPAQLEAFNLALARARGEGGFIPTAQNTILQAAQGQGLDSFVPQSALGALNGFAGSPQAVAGTDVLGRVANSSAIDPQTLEVLRNTAGGNFLFGGQGFDQAVDAAIRAAQPSILSRFGAGGAGAGTGGLAQTAIAQAGIDAFAGQFGQERSNQLNAANALSQLGLNDRGQQMQAAQSLGQLDLSGRAQQLDASSILAGLGNDERSRQLTAAQLLPSMATADADILSRVGGIQQDQAQRELTAPIQAMLQLLDASQTGGLSSLLGSSQNVPTDRNKLLEGLGIATAGTDLLGNLFGEGGLFGGQGNGLMDRIGNLFGGGGATPELTNALNGGISQGVANTEATNAADLANMQQPSLATGGANALPALGLGAGAGALGAGLLGGAIPAGTVTIAEGAGLAGLLGGGGAAGAGAAGAGTAAGGLLGGGTAGAAGSAGAAGGALGGGAGAGAAGAGAAGAFNPLAATGVGLLAALPMIVSAFDSGDTARDRRAHEMSRALGLVNVRTVDGRQLIGLPNGTFVEPSGDVSRFLRHESPQETLNYLYSLPTVEHTYQRLPGRQTGKQPRRQED